MISIFACTKTTIARMGDAVEARLFKETILDLIKEPPAVKSKPSRYVSTHADKTRAYYKTNKEHNVSLGPAKVPLRTPNAYLKKHEKEKTLPEKAPFQYKDASSRKPNLPKDTPVFGVNSNKDFIRENTIDAIHTQPFKKHVVSPVYKEKKDYGKTPQYLSRIQAQPNANEPERMSTQLSSSAPQPGVKMLTQAELAVLRKGLKANWEKVNDEYQKLSLTVDTPPKIARKTFLERTLQQLEKDIDRMSFNYVFVKTN